MSCPVKDVNKPDHSDPLKMLSPATTGNDEIISSPDLQHQRRKKNLSVNNINSASLSKVTLSK